VGVYPPFPLDCVIEFLYIRRGQKGELLVSEIWFHISTGGGKYE